MEEVHICEEDQPSIADWPQEGKLYQLPLFQPSACLQPPPSSDCKHMKGHEQELSRVKVLGATPSSSLGNDRDGKITTYCSLILGVCYAAADNQNSFSVIDCHR